MNPTKRLPKELNLCLVSDPVPTTEYAEGFAGKKKTAMRRFIRSKAQIFPTVLETLGDGNCFYRSFLTGLLAFHKHSSVEARKSTLVFLDEMAAIYHESPSVTAPIKLLKLLISNAPLLSPLAVLDILNDRKPSDSLVSLLRVLIGHEMQALDEYMTEEAQAYIFRTVLPMGTWGGQLEATTAQKIFNVQISITDLKHQSRLVCGGHSPDIQADIELIYTGGHYDLFDLDFSHTS